MVPWPARSRKMQGVVHNAGCDPAYVLVVDVRTTYASHRAVALAFQGRAVDTVRPIRELNRRMLAYPGRHQRPRQIENR